VRSAIRTYGHRHHPGGAISGAAKQQPQNEQNEIHRSVHGQGVNWENMKAENQFRIWLRTQDFAGAGITASSVRQTVLLPVLFF
jgi:hypothetical protein